MSGAFSSQAGVVLLYHHVDATTPAITSIAPDQFARHLEILDEENFQVVPLATLVEQSLNAAPNSPEELERLVAITFDDAYISIYETAFPMLKARKWPFTIFVATDYVESNPLYLNWSQLREMTKNGATIANHTQSHTHLVRSHKGESQAQWRSSVLEEITGAQNILSSSGFVSDYFAYPYGEYNLSLFDLVNSLGFIAFGQQSGAIGPHSNPLLLPRFPLAGIYVGEDAFRDKINSLALPIQHPEIEPLVTSSFMPPLSLKFLTETPGLTDLYRLTCYGPGGKMALAEGEINEIIATPLEPVAVGRTRYNCTLPASNGRFYWFSQLWMRKQDDASWYPEP